MGHYRIGGVPRTKKWRDIVSSVYSTTEINKEYVTEIANKTLDASSQALRKLPFDQSVQHCFQFLLTLAVAGQSKDIKNAFQHLGINLTGDPNKLQLSRALRDWIGKETSQTDNPEFTSLARQATTDTITDWLNKHLSNPQLNLFAQAEDPFKPWAAASDGSGFCELSRTFFANFTSRYLNYFLSRTASSQFKTLSERDEFEKALKANIDVISQHAFETTKLVQSFSAGWFNKHAIGKVPTPIEIEGFLSHSFEKIREEFRREKEATK